MDAPNPLTIEGRDEAPQPPAPPAAIGECLAEGQGGNADRDKFEQPAAAAAGAAVGEQGVWPRVLESPTSCEHLQSRMYVALDLYLYPLQRVSRVQMHRKCPPAVYDTSKILLYSI